MTKHAWAIITCFGLVGCGARPGGGGGGLPGPTPGPSVAPSAQVVVVQNFQFSPATVTVAPGTVVTWRFMDAVAHTATSASASSEQWDSGLLASGQTYSRTFNMAGTFPYYCQPHPFMTGTVVVR